MKFNKLMLFVFVLGLAVSTFAQKDWEKPFQKWGKEDALMILKESPWATSYQSADGTVAAEQAQSARDQADQRIIGRPTTSRLDRNFAPQPIVVRLQSGLPIRQALVRLQQIEGGYDKMNEEKRKEFDARVKEFLDCPVCNNYYVITLTKMRRSATEGVDDAMFQKLKMEEIKGNIHLVNDKGERRELAHVIIPERAGDSAVLFFPRKDAQGNLLYTPDSKTIKITFEKVFIENKTNPYGALLPRSFEFKASKMMINNELAF